MSQVLYGFLNYSPLLWLSSPPKQIKPNTDKLNTRKSIKPSHKKLAIWPRAHYRVVHIFHQVLRERERKKKINRDPAVQIRSQRNLRNLLLETSSLQYRYENYGHLCPSAKKSFESLHTSQHHKPISDLKVHKRVVKLVRLKTPKRDHPRKFRDAYDI